MELCLNQSLGGCKPIQIINFGMAFNDISGIAVYDSCGNAYDMSSLEYAYSMDNVCWSCYMSFDDLVEITDTMLSDAYVRVKVPGDIGKVTLSNEDFYDYTTQLYSGFQLTGCDSQQSTNMYNPYSNMEGAVQLQQSLVEAVGCMLGIPIYYFSVSGVSGSKDITFKEYALYKISNVKQIKMIVADGQMPSSKPEFSEWGLDWQTDWEVEIPKGMFATAFGKNTVPIEGDLVYIPMMKRMWMVAQAYEEKRDSLMWNATTFKVALTKYQQDASVDMGDAESMINDIVKNKYEDLFEDTDADTSGFSHANETHVQPNNLYPVYMSDDQRKYITCDNVNVRNTSLYFRSTLIADNCYTFPMLQDKAQVIYQKKYCGEDISLSFIISSDTASEFSGDVITFGNKKLSISQHRGKATLSLNIDPKLKVSFPSESNKYWFVTLRWSRQLRNVEMTVFEYKYPENIPLYKLSSHHYYFDMDNPTDKAVSRWNQEMKQIDEAEVSVHGFVGTISNIKFFNEYNDNISEMLMQYPNNKSLIINDTCRPLIGLDGVAPK